MVREIVTIQIGSSANYLATHFWNTQVCSAPAATPAWYPPPARTLDSSLTHELQESYFTYGDEERSPVNHDVHWRQGLGADGSETFLPRTLIYDFKSSFGPLGKVNSLYETDTNSTLNLGLWLV